MKWIMLLALATLAVGQAYPQRGPGRGMAHMEERSQEMQETLRFIRLAESKRTLDFLDEQELLKVNELFDAFEKDRFQFRHKEGALRQEISKKMEANADATAELDKLMALRSEQQESDAALWTNLKALLDPNEASKTYIFYEKFQRQMLRKAREIMRDRQGEHRNKRGPGNRD